MDKVLAYILEIVSQCIKLGKVDACIEGSALQRCYQSFGAGLAGRFGERRKRGINHVRTGFNSLQVSHIAHTAGEVGVQVDRQVKFRLQAADKAFGSVGTQQACHILDTDGICAHLRQFLT